ncbi:MAG: hypothetical protein RI907_1166 [Pseudomonadota bacterium]|jgi:phage tail sheath protein FI
MPTYRTPDVYVEEISVFPPSVAEVATAVPAFVGYTAQATRSLSGDLKNVPTRITSMLEYQQLFGGAPKLDISKVLLDDGGNFQRVELGTGNNRHLFDAIRLFYDNGGGPCYVVSVGDYNATPDKADLTAGLAEVAKVDEPTILVTPDAASLPADDLANVQQQALAQCGKLGDRVALLDPAFYDNKTSHGTSIQSLRDKMGINSLKYGAAYAPWLRIAYPKAVGFADLTAPTTKLYKGSQPVDIATLTSEADLLAKITRLKQVMADQPKIEAAKTTLLGGRFTAKQDGLLIAYQGSKIEDNLEKLFGFLMDAARAIDGLVVGAGKVSNADLVTAIQGQITSLASVYEPVLNIELELKAVPLANYDVQQSLGAKPAATQWGTIFTAAAPSAGNVPTGVGVTKLAQLDSVLPTLLAAFTAVGSALAQITAAAATYVANDEAYLGEHFSLYRGILKGVSNATTVCPPSGAIAGIYALVDNQRGVWKAPANVSLTGVLAPTYLFDQDDTDNLNIDATSGKSVNAIRAFAGKGTLIWGARTLAGNDNEWRYVSVRRFFNMVEESVKKSTYWAVFEPNDANTWVKVRGMIENYLTQKWREGALAGASTKDAFFVRCGLGTTMSSQDILEGRLIVEIGMAVVRPAEFIVLKFSHKLQTS